MELLNLTPFAASWRPSMARDDHQLALVVVMASFEIGPDRSPRLAAEQPEPPTADEYEDPDARSLRVEGQTAYVRPGTDIYVRGHAWAPGGVATTHADFAIEVGPCRKLARVVGERVFVRSVGATTISPPARFERMAITWTRSFGGSPPGLRGRALTIAEHNPAGCGLYESARAAADRPLPNFEDPRALIREYGDLPMPVGFGPIGRWWLPRRKFAGTYDQDWIDHRAPLWPKDMDERVFCGAAPGLCAVPHLRGGEPVRLLGLFAEGIAAFSLPRLALQASFGFRRRRVRRPLILDAIDIDGDQRRLGLIWRASVVADDDLLELESLTIRECRDWEVEA